MHCLLVVPSIGIDGVLLDGCVLVQAFDCSGFAGVAQLSPETCTTFMWLASLINESTEIAKALMTLHVAKVCYPQTVGFRWFG